MNKKSVITLLLLIPLASLAQSKQGQQLVDSITTVLLKAAEDTGKVKLLNKAGQTLLLMNEFDKAISFGKQSLTLSTTLHYINGMAAARQVMGSSFLMKGEYAEATKSTEKAIELWKQTTDKGSTANSYNQMARIYIMQGNYPLTLNNMYRALELYEQAGNKKGMGNMNNNIGIVYIDQKRYDEALPRFIKALQLYDEIGDSLARHHPYNNLGNIYIEKGNYKEAIKNYENALRLRRQLGDKYEISVVLSNLGICYQDLKDYTKAEEYYTESLKLSRELDLKEQTGVYLSNLASVRMLQKRFSEAKQLLDSSLEIHKKTGYVDGLRGANLGLSDLDSSTGNYKGAYQHYKKYIFYRDSLQNDENAGKLVQTQMQYDFDKKEAATKAEQEKKDAIAQNELQKQKLVRNGFIGGFALVLIFAGVFFAQRNKIKAGKKRSDELLLNILPEETAEELKANGTAKAKHFDEVTVLFTDFKNFTAMSEKLSAEELVNEINFCYSAFDNIITQYGIEKIKTIGDAYMCAGGLPVPNKTNAEDTVKAALELKYFMLNEKQKRDAAGKPFFEIRIGCHTGPVVAGIVGIKKFAYDIWGDTVNIASRMESGGEPGKVNISGATHTLVKDKFKCEHRGKIHAKNKGEIDMYFVEEK